MTHPQRQPLTSGGMAYRAEVEVGQAKTATSIQRAASHCGRVADGRTPRHMHLADVAQVPLSAALGTPHRCVLCTPGTYVVKGYSAFPGAMVFGALSAHLCPACISLEKIIFQTRPVHPSRGFCLYVCRSDRCRGYWCRIGRAFQKENDVTNGVSQHISPYLLNIIVYPIHDDMIEESSWNIIGLFDCVCVVDRRFVHSNLLFFTSKQRMSGMLFPIISQVDLRTFSGFDFHADCDDHAMVFVIVADD